MVIRSSNLRKKILNSVFKATTTVGLLGTSAVPQAVQAQSLQSRPSQYVLFSFDGSYNLGTWKTLRDFSKTQKAKGAETRFTFFISGVYFLQPNNRSVYVPPQHGVGRSDIGIGDSSEDIGLRVDEVNSAFREGHEMGSHANGHFSGASWSESEWTSEFSQFEKFIFGVFDLNKIDPRRSVADGWLVRKENIKGFRAPLLDTSTGLWATMKKFNFSYDCSRIASPNYWPEKLSTGLWNFPLAELKIAGTSKKTLSMDYNFYVSQSGGKNDSANKELYKKQMVDTYMAWFQSNYNGNRAPLNIGHHFSQWNGGAYFEAIRQFAANVCGLPEVKCVTYTEYMNWLESLQPQVLADLRKGQFKRVETPLQVASVEPEVMATTRLVERLKGNAQTFFVRTNVTNMSDLENLRARISVNGHMLNQSEISVDEIRDLLPDDNDADLTAHLYDRTGREVARATQKIHDIQAFQIQLSEDIQEKRALKGDLPEAHLDERENNEVF